MMRRPRHSGFTLIELLVVVAIIALLVSILLPSLGRAKAITRQAVCATAIRQLALANLGYAAENDGRFVLAAEDILVGNGGRKRWHGERLSPGVSADPAENVFDPLKGPLVGYLSTGEVKECPSFSEYTQDGAANAFEAGTGGFGYNQMYIGGRFDIYPLFDREEQGKAARYSAGEDEVRHPSDTVMFADAAMAQPGGAIIEYSFCEPPRFTSLLGPATRHPDASIHFRHLDACNVAWVDTHVAPMDFAFTEKYMAYNVSETQLRDLGIGWFEPDGNDLFDLE